MLQIGIAEILHYKAQEVLSLKTPWIEIHLLPSNTPLHTCACEAIFEFGEGYRLATPIILSCSSQLVFFFSRKPKMFYLVVVTSPDKPFTQPLVSASEVCIN